MNGRLLSAFCKDAAIEVYGTFSESIGKSVRVLLDDVITRVNFASAELPAVHVE